MFLKNSKRNLVKTMALALILALISPSAFAAEASKAAKEPVVVNGDKVEYFQDKKKVEGSGNISIDYKGIKLTCDKVTVYLDTREAIAEGNVKVTQKDGAYFTGDRMNFNFDTQKGTVLKGYVKANPFYGKAAKVEKAGPDKFGLDNGYITTCELEKPHYRVQSQKVMIYMDDKLVANNTLLYAGNVPVMYIPYYVMPLKDMKKNNITLIPGKNGDWGYYVLGSYRYFFNEDFKGDILLDYRSKKGLGEGINHYYGLGDIGSGSLKAYYTHENDNLAFEKSGAVNNRYRYQLRHRWDMPPETDATAIVEFNKLSDKDAIKDYFYKEFEELQDPANFNYVSVVTSKPDYTTELLLRKRFDKFYSVVERMPEYKIDIKNHRMTEKYPVYYRANASGSYLNQTFDNTSNANQTTANSGGQKDIDVVRFDTYNQISYAARLFKFMNVTPYAGTEQTYYSRNRWGDTNLIRGALVTGVDNSTKFYKIYDVDSDYMGLDINKLRHIVTPSANFYHTETPTIALENLNQMDTIDALEAQNGIRLQLENKLQTKRPQGEDMVSVDIANLIVSSDYMFRLKEDNVSYKSQKFKSVDFQLDLVPYPWLYTLSKLSVNTKKYIVGSGSVDLVGNGGDKWSLGVGYRYEDVESGYSNLATVGGMYKINDKWSVRTYHRLNIENCSFDEQEYTVSRDLHCWLLDVTYNVKNRDEQGVWFVLRLKAFPEYPIGLRRTYYRPKFGSAGNN